MSTLLRLLSLATAAAGIVLLWPTQVSAQQLRVEMVWEIGEINGPPQIIWERISDAVIFNDRVIASDLAMAEVRAYSLSGGFIGLLGGPGPGPEEFGAPHTMLIVRDTLFVYDGGYDRWVLFDRDGNHVRTARPEIPQKVSFYQRIWIGRHGFRVGETHLVGRRLPSECDSTHLTIAWRPFGQTDTLASIPGNPYWIDSASLNSLVMHTVENLGPSGGTWVMGDSLLVLVDGVGSEGSLFLLTEDGLEEVRQRSLPGTRQRLTEADREAAANAYFRKYDVDPAHTSIRRFVLPEYWSAWTRVRGDEKGGVWLRRGGPELVDPSRGEQWVRWDLADDEFRELDMPPGVEILQFGEGHAVGLRRDEWGVEYLVLYRISGLDS